MRIPYLAPNRSMQKIRRGPMPVTQSGNSIKVRIQRHQLAVHNGLFDPECRACQKLKAQAESSNEKPL